LKTYCIISVLFLISFSTLYAQENNGFLYFEEDSVYLGRFQKNHEPITHTFNFKVVGNSVQIEKITSDCACTTPDYPKQEMSIGKRGSLKIAFSPYRSGPFEKHFLVKLKGVQESIQLTMAGYVDIFYPDPTLEFPHVVGDIRLKSRKISLGTISNEGVVSRKVEIYNQADFPVVFQDSIIAPKHIEFIFDSLRTIPPKSRKHFELFYNPKLKEDFGYVIDNITLFTEDTTIALPIDASIKQYFPEIDEIDFDDAPELITSTDSINLGTIYLEVDRVIEFDIQNHGRVNLMIHKIIANYGSESLMITPQIIKPNETAGLRVRVKDIGKSGNQQRSVTLFTNDPMYPTKELVVFMNVKR